MLFEFAELHPSLPYKLLTATVVPRPIAWVLTADSQGRLNLAPFSFFNVMSGDPPIVCLGIGRRPEGPPKDSLTNIRQTEIMRIHLVPHRLGEAMNVSAIAFAPGVNEVEQAGLQLINDGQPLPRLQGCPVAFLCRLQQWVEVGKQQGIVVAEVTNAFIEDHLVLDAQRGHIDTPRLDLIARMHGSGWYSRPEQWFQLERMSPQEWELNR